jgi:sugar phosphate permease
MAVDTSKEALSKEMAHKELAHPSSAPLPPPPKKETPREILPQAQPQPPYSHFTKRQKRLIVFIITFAATFSPLSSFIFFPAINALSASLYVSVEKVNLTITSYMIVAGIAPAIIGDMADMTGRRIVYLLTIGLYCVANVGLAVQNSWTALFVLRMLQSAGGAGS